MKTISGIQEIIKQYEVFLIDQWGVMHDGNNGYDHALECINLLNRNNKKMIIISNSSKRKNNTIKRLPKLGFNPNHFIDVLTSGELIWQTISKDLNKYGKNLNKCFHIFDSSKEDGLIYRKGLTNLDFVDNINDASFILACTPFDNSEPIDYIPILTQAYEKNLLMFCANPDFETIENNKYKNIYCMGTISKLYESMGGKVIIQGKPSIEIYNEALKSVKDYDKKTIIAVGDSIFHDVLGANQFGVDSILITSGIHSENFSSKKPVWDNSLNSLIKHNINPKYLCSKFCY